MLLEIFYNGSLAQYGEKKIKVEVDLTIRIGYVSKSTSI